MATSARELVGWTEQRWTAIEEATRRALARTAKCRRVIPIGAEQIGTKGVVIPTIEGSPVAYGEDTVISPIWIFVDVTLDDQHADDEAAVFRLVESAAAQLGVREDKYVIQSISPTTKQSAAAIPQAEALPQGSGSRLRIPTLPPANLTKNKRDAKQTRIDAKGAAPTADEIVKAVRTAQGELETAGRPGPCGLLLHSRLFATLADLSPGGAPYLQHIEHLIDSSDIAGTSALEGSNVAGILFRLEPSAFELVQTAQPTVTVLERSGGKTGGQTSLRVEEDVVVRIFDEAAIHHIIY
jgi:uncharacterized linocin/CFP29 family protein